MIKAVYARFGHTFDMDCMSLESGKEILQIIEDDGDGYAIGVFDAYSGIFYSPNNMDIADKDENTVRQEKIESLSAIGITPNKFEVYGQSN